MNPVSYPDVFDGPPVLRWNRGTTTAPSPPELDAIASMLAPTFVVVSERCIIKDGKPVSRPRSHRVLRVVPWRGDTIYLPLEVN